MDAQGGFAKVKSFKDTWDAFGDKNQFVTDQVAVQTAQQWYVNVLSNTKDDVSLAAVPIKTLEGEPIAMAGGTAFAVAAAGKNKSAACAWAINATSEAAWTAAGEARAKTVEEKKSINTGLFTASPVLPTRPSAPSSSSPAATPTSTRSSRPSTTSCRAT